MTDDFPINDDNLDWLTDEARSTYFEDVPVETTVTFDEHNATFCLTCN